VPANKLLDLLYQAGFRGQGLDMAYAIAMAESAGNARAHNGNAGTGDNSYGLFQINMLGSMGPERRQQYGLSSNDDLFDPLTNARVAYKMSNGGRSWSPWSTYKNGAYQRYMGGSQTVSVTSSGSSSSGSGVTGGGTSSGSTYTPPKMTAKELAEQYGFVQGLINSDAGLKKLFKQAVAETWSTDKFQASLRDTNWFKTHSQQERDYLVKQFGDPATARQNYSAAYVHVRQLANQLGIVETTANMNRMKTWAYDNVAKGWNDDQLRNEIGKYVYFVNDTWQGQGGQEQEALHSYAYDMGVTMSGTWYANNSRNIIRGVATEEDYKSEIRKQAKALFPQYAKQIDAGQKVTDLAGSYFQSMSQILELPAGSINLFNPLIKKALQYKNPTTGQGEAKPLWQFENDLRSDPRWNKTQNAQNSLMQVAHQVLSDFGLKF